MDYFSYNIIGLDIFTHSPTLGNPEDEPLGEETTSLHYSVNILRNFTTYRDIGIALSWIELEDHFLINFIPQLIV